MPTVKDDAAAYQIILVGSTINTLLQSVLFNLCLGLEPSTWAATPSGESCICSTQPPKCTLLYLPGLDSQKFTLLRLCAWVPSLLTRGVTFVTVFVVVTSPTYTPDDAPNYF